MTLQIDRGGKEIPDIAIIGSLKTIINLIVCGFFFVEQLAGLKLENPIYTIIKYRN